MYDKIMSHCNIYGKQGLLRGLLRGYYYATVTQRVAFGFNLLPNSYATCYCRIELVTQQLLNMLPSESMCC